MATNPGYFGTGACTLALCDQIESIGGVWYQDFVFVLRHPDAPTCDRVLTRSTGSEVTYSRVGATFTDEFPEGFKHDRYEVVVGNGDGAFARAKAGLRAWKAHLGAGVDIYPTDARLIEGTTLLGIFRVGPLHTITPCRIVKVVDDEDRFGFAYGTLPGHPETGEEAFMVERGGRGAVRFRVLAFSRPADPLARLGSPAARVFQRRVTMRYLEALKGFVEEDVSGS